MVDYKSPLLSWKNFALRQNLTPTTVESRDALGIEDY